MKQVMGERIIFQVKPHSFVDLITNSSTELYIVDISKSNEILVEVFNVIKEAIDGYSDSIVEKFDDSNYKNEYIIPDGIDTSTLYCLEIDYKDTVTYKIIEKLFSIVHFKYNGESEYDD